MSYSLINKIIILLCIHNTHIYAQQTQLEPLHHTLIINKNAATNIWVVDDVYEHPELIRYMALQEEFYVKGNFPGPRTRSYATATLKEKIEQIIGKPIIRWRDDKTAYNGAFQYSTSRERSWIHTDAFNSHAGVLYLTPDAPLSAGTATFRYKPTLDLSLIHI